MLVRLAGTELLGSSFFTFLIAIWEQLRQISRCQVVSLGQVMPGIRMELSLPNTGYVGGFLQVQHYWGVNIIRELLNPGL